MSTTDILRFCPASPRGGRPRKYAGDQERRDANARAARAYRARKRHKNPPVTHSIRIEEITLATARPFIEKWHYSKRVPTGKNVFFGCFLNGRLYCVADYGIGVNTVQAAYLARITRKPVTDQSLYELKRLCRRDPQNAAMPLTKFLSICHRMLRRYGIRFVVSFSDPAHGHNGGIYRAANFTHLGTSGAEWHVEDAAGKRRHRRVAYNLMKRENKRRTANAPPQMTLAEARQALGLRRVKTVPKDRWFLDLGKQRDTRAYRQPAPLPRPTFPRKP